MKYHIMKGDHVLSYFKFERRTNYKSGIYDSLGLFENRFNFLAFYRVFMFEATFVNHNFENKGSVDSVAMGSFITQSEKEHM